jgi:DNA-binding CsgD family transcriptional regulator
MSVPPDWDDVFLSAALEPDKWPDALQRMADEVGATHGQLIGVGNARDIPFNIVTNFDSSFLREFAEEIDGGSPSVNFRVAVGTESVAQGRYDAILHERHYDAVMPSLQVEPYLQWCEKADIPFGCQTNLVVDRSGLVGLAILRKRREGRTTPGHRKIFAQASLAARRAVRLQERLEGNQASLLAGAFEAISATAYILDRRGRVQAMTRSAEQIISEGDIKLADKQLDAAGTPVNLRKMIAALVAEDGFEHIRLRVDCSNGRPPLFLEGFRLQTHRWSLGSLPHAILLAKPPQRDRAGVAAFLSVLYRLTETEAEIAMRLFDGKSRAEICEERSITAETLRGYVKTVCSKSGARNEADLMRLLAALMT